MPLYHLEDYMVNGTERAQRYRKSQMVKQHTARTIFTCAWHPCALATASGAAQTLPYAYTLDTPRLTPLYRASDLPQGRETRRG